MNQPTATLTPTRTEAEGAQTKLLIRPATLADAPQIKALIDPYAAQGLMLFKTLSDLYGTVRDFVVCSENGNLVGAGALHILWEDLAELRSLAVRDTHRGRGIGKQIGKALLEEAQRLGVGRVFALTYETQFFLSLGFRVIDKTLLPRKIWSDCVNCHKFPICDEVAVIRDFKPYPEGPVGPPPELPQVINLEKLVPHIAIPPSA